jgi:hypothetical protein
MNHHRTSYAIVICALFAVTYALPASAWPRSGNPCKQMQRDLDRQVDDLKSRQKDELRQCERTSGRASIACLSRKDQQQEELRGMRDYRTRQVAGCRSLGRGATPFPPVTVGGVNLAGDTDDLYYQSRSYCDEYHHMNCYPSRHHHDHDKYPHKHYKHGDPPPRGGGAGVKATKNDPGKRPPPPGHVPAKTPRPTDTAIGGASRDHATSQVNHAPERADSSSSTSSSGSPSAHGSPEQHSSASPSSANQGHSRSSDSGSGGGGSNSGSSHSSGAGSASSSGSASSGSSHSGSSSSGSSSSGGGGASSAGSSHSGSSSSGASSASHDSGGSSRDAGGSRPK